VDRQELHESQGPYFRKKTEADYAVKVNPEFVGPLPPGG
jgi:hypothetical protein